MFFVDSSELRYPVLPKREGVHDFPQGYGLEWYIGKFCLKYYKPGKNNFSKINENLFSQKNKIFLPVTIVWSRSRSPPV